MIEGVELVGFVPVMRVIFFLSVGAMLFTAASFLAVLSYGHFAKHARGEPSAALPFEPSFTILDNGVAPRVEAAGGKSGLTLLSGNLDAFAARALTARAAGRSLDLMYYYWRGDLTGRLLANEVLAAADRGVRVRLLLDDINTTGNDEIYLALDSHANIEVRLFNPSRARSGGLRRGIEMALRAFSVTRRMHNKAWIADGRLAIIGGRNVGDQYFDAAETSNFRDIDMMLMGPLVQETETVFDAFWNSPVTMPIHAVAEEGEARLGELRRTLARLSQGDSAAPYIQRVQQRISVLSMLDGGVPTHWTSDARIISDPPEKALSQGSDNWIMSTLMSVIASAQKSVQITSPYFVPGTVGTANLKMLTEAGVEVEVLTNSLAATDVALVHGGYAPYRVPLLASGVQLYELQPYVRKASISLLGSRGASLHTKAFTVDDHTGFVGSFNFDPRSASLNTEMGVLFVEPGLVARLREIFRSETSPQMSYRVYLEDGSLRWEGEDENRMTVWDHEPEASFMRRLVARIVSWLPIESQL